MQKKELNVKSWEAKCGVEVSLKSQKVVSPCFQPPKTKPLKNLTLSQVSLLTSQKGIERHCHLLLLDFVGL